MGDKERLVEVILVSNAIQYNAGISADGFNGVWGAGVWDVCCWILVGYC